MRSIIIILYKYNNIVLYTNCNLINSYLFSATG